MQRFVLSSSHRGQGFQPVDKTWVFLSDIFLWCFVADARLTGLVDCGIGCQNRIVVMGSGAKLRARRTSSESKEGRYAQTYDVGKSVAGRCCPCRIDRTDIWHREKGLRTI